MRSIYIIFLLFAICVQSCKTSNRSLVGFSKSDKVHPSRLIANLPGQYPEGIEFDKNRNLFFLSAINKNPAIATVDFSEKAMRFSNDGAYSSSSSFGLQIDYENKRLLACTNNAEVSGLNIYDLKSGELKRRVELSALLKKESKFQANDLIFDADDNIYVTGRLEHLIYKVSNDLKPSIFFERKDLTLPNGIVYHPKNYLLVSYINDNSKLVKIPIDDPNSATDILIKGLDFIGFDGMIINQKGNLVAVMKVPNSKLGCYVIELTSTDNWDSATVVNKVRVERSTTIVETGLDEYYVLNQDWKNPKAKTWELEQVKF